VGDAARTYFGALFKKSEGECKVEVQFNSDGQQFNAVRELLIAICSAADPVEKRRLATSLASRLYAVTDERNQTGLFAIIEGKSEETSKILLIRFRQDEVVTTNPHGDAEIDLSVIAEAFTKRSHFYKSALFEDEASRSMFWTGRIVDKQITKTVRDVSQYWVADFLDSRSALTPKQGTTSLSRFIRVAIGKLDNVEDKQTLIAASLLLKQQAGKNFSAKEFCETYLSGPLAESFKGFIPSEIEYENIFEVDADTLEKEIGSTLLSLSNGIQLTVPTFLYDDTVTEKHMQDGGTEVTVSGRVVDRKLGKKANSRQ
jgi:hypothetical protein